MNKNSLISQISNCLLNLRDSSSRYFISSETAEAFFTKEKPANQNTTHYNKKSYTKEESTTTTSSTPETPRQNPPKPKTQSPDLSHFLNQTKAPLPQADIPAQLSPNNKLTPQIENLSLNELHRLCSPANQQTQALNHSAKLVIIDEFNRSHPSPFEGETGEMLAKMILAMGFDSLDDIYLTRVDVLKKSTPENRTNEMQAALKKQIDTIKPQAVIAMGNSPLRLLTGQNGIQQLRGNILDYNGIPLMPTLPPLFIQRQHGPEKLQFRKLVWSDLQQVMKILQSS